MSLRCADANCCPYFFWKTCPHSDQFHFDHVRKNPLCPPCQGKEQITTTQYCHKTSSPCDWTGPCSTGSGHLHSLGLIEDLLKHILKLFSLTKREENINFLLNAFLNFFLTFRFQNKTVCCLFVSNLLSFCQFISFAFGVLLWYPSLLILSLLYVTLMCGFLTKPFTAIYYIAPASLDNCKQSWKLYWCNCCNLCDKINHFTANSSLNFITYWGWQKQSCSYHTRRNDYQSSPHHWAYKRAVNW